MSEVFNTPFTKFNSLIQTHSKSTQKLLDAYGDLPAMVTEKIHGTNLTVATDGVNVRFGRRNGWLDEDESFFGLEYIKEELKSRILYAYQQTKEVVMEHHMVADKVEAAGEEATRPIIPRDFKILQLRGEFFGGYYNHPDAPVYPNVSPVQTGVSYCQDKSFSVFRIEIDDFIMPMDDAYLFCQSFGVPFAPVLSVGTLRECFKWSQENKAHNTVIPYGVAHLDPEGNPIIVEKDGKQAYQTPPKFEDGENLREGHVITTLKPVCLPNGSYLAFKDKNDKFAESKPPRKAKAAPQPFKGAQKLVFDAVLPLLTTERLNSVNSKEGPLTSGELQRATGLVVQDAIDELAFEYDDFAPQWNGLNTKERKQLTRSLNFECINAIREHFFTIVE